MSFCILLAVLYLQERQHALRAGFDVFSRLRKSHPFRWAKAQDSRLDHLRAIAEWDKPVGLKVVGLVFYGRKRYVEVLECYLKV